MTLTPTASSRGERSRNASESRGTVPWKKHERCVWCPRNSQWCPRNSQQNSILALPTFEWVKNNVHTIPWHSGNLEDSGFFRALDCVEFEYAAVKENGRLQMLPIAEAIIVCLIVLIFELSPSLVVLETQVPRPGGRQDAASRHPGIGRKAINPITVLVVTD